MKIDGEPVNGPRDDVGMIFQQHNIIEEMTAYTNALSGSLNRTSLVRSLFSGTTARRNSTRSARSTPSACSTTPNSAPAA